MPDRTTVNNLEFSRRGTVSRGEIAVADLARLRDVLLADRGAVTYTLSGVTGPKGEPLLTLGVEGMLVLQCQRCLEALAFPLHVAATFKVVEGGNEFEALDDETDAVDSIPADAEMDVATLVEDEILLGLPMAPLHPPGVCEAHGAAEPAHEEKTNPFGALAALKGKV